MKNPGSFKTLTYLSLFGLAITVPLLLLVGALLFQSGSVQRAQLESHVFQVLDALVNNIDRDLDRDITILHTLATSQALARADWPRFYNEAKAGLQGRAYLVLIDSNGRQLVNTYVPYGEQPALTGDMETLRRILATKAPVVSNLFTSLVVKKPVFNVSIPILQGDQVHYVMSLGLLPDDLVALLKSQRLGSEWVTLIWDAKGVILARSRNDSRFVGTQLPQNMRERPQRVVSRTANLDGTDVWRATAVSQVSGWGVGVNIPYSLVTEQMRTSLLLWGAAALIAISIAFVSGLFFARQITTSLSVAAKAAAAFGRGEQFPLIGSRLQEAGAFLVTLNDAQQSRQKGEAVLLRLNEDLKQFTFAATHDLREPLRMMTVNVQMLERKLAEELDEESRGYISNVVKGGERISRLIDGLLEFSRLGEVDTSDRVPVNAESALKEALDNLQIVVGETKATVLYNGLPVVMADQVHLCQLFQNLVGNALKYRKPQLPPEIRISAAREGSTWMFAVQDNGIGVAPEHHTSIFVPFKRLHGSEVAGAGIGLATCKRIVERYGGRIWIESKEGEGSTFRFTLSGAEE